MPKNRGPKKRGGRSTVVAAAPTPLQILAAHNIYTAPGRKWKKHYSALVVNISVDDRDTSVSFSGWLSDEKGSGYRVLNKARLDFDTASDEELVSAVGMEAETLASEKEIVIVFSAHATVGWGLGNDLSEGVRHNAALMSETELVGAMRFASFVHRASRLLRVNIAGVVLNGCNTGTELVGSSDKFVPSSARLLSCILPDTPVVGIVGTCADAKVNGIYLPGRGGKLCEKTIGRLDAAILCQGGAVVDGCTDLCVTHQYTAAGVKDYLGLGSVGVGDVYLASGHEATISALMAKRASRSDCHGLRILRRAMFMGANFSAEMLLELLRRVGAGAAVAIDDVEEDEPVVEAATLAGGEEEERAVVVAEIRGGGDGGAAQRVEEARRAAQRLVEDHGAGVVVARVEDEPVAAELTGAGATVASGLKPQGQ